MKIEKYFDKQLKRNCWRVNVTINNVRHRKLSRVCVTRGTQDSLVSSKKSGCPSFCTPPAVAPCACPRGISTAGGCAPQKKNMPKPKLYSDDELLARKRVRNAIAMAKKRRAAQGLPIDAPAYTSICGERASAAKLTAKAVKKYRKMRESGHTVGHLAEMAGVSKSTMSNALRGVTFKDV
jgi:hypothetical protein